MPNNESSGPPRPSVSCRLFHEELPNGRHVCGADHGDEWFLDLVDAAAGWTIDTADWATFWPSWSADLCRLGQTIGNDIATLAETEGEKLALAGKINGGTLEARRYASTNRTLKFVVDGQLELAVGMCHRLLNLMALTVYAHPFWAAETTSTWPKGLKAKGDHWPGLSKYRDDKRTRECVDTANRTGQKDLIAMVEQWEAIAVWEKRVELFVVRGKRHHQNGASLPPGVEHTPFGDRKGVVLGEGAVRHIDPSGDSIDPNAEATERLGEAWNAGTAFLFHLGKPLRNLSDLWRNAHRQLLALEVGRPV